MFYLTNKLADADAQIRGQAALALGYVGEESDKVIPALSLVAAQDLDAQVRSWALVGLYVFGSVRSNTNAFSAIQRGLQDPDEGVRDEAASLLDRVRAEAREK